MQLSTFGIDKARSPLRMCCIVVLSCYESTPYGIKELSNCSFSTECRGGQYIAAIVKEPLEFFILILVACSPLHVYPFQIVGFFH